MNVAFCLGQAMLVDNASFVRLNGLSANCAQDHPRFSKEHHRSPFLEF
jgi:hypothetical protein